jgi:hypothetical protein
LPTKIPSLWVDAEYALSFRRPPKPVIHSARNPEGMGYRAARIILNISEAASAPSVERTSIFSQSWRIPQEYPLNLVLFLASPCQESANALFFPHMNGRTIRPPSNNQQGITQKYLRIQRKLESSYIYPDQWSFPAREKGVLGKWFFPRPPNPGHNSTDEQRRNGIEAASSQVKDKPSYNRVKIAPITNIPTNKIMLRFRHRVRLSRK